MDQAKIYIITGPSGVGKDLIASELLKNPALKLVRGKTYTTRPFRASDAVDKKYIHISQDEFKALQQNGEIFETNYYNGNWYGSGIQMLFDETRDGNVLIILDPNGAKTYQDKFQNAVVIFLDSNIGELKQRLKKRGQNTNQEIDERIAIAQKELNEKNIFKYVVQNPPGRPEQAVAKIEKIIHNLNQ